MNIYEMKIGQLVDINSTENWSKDWKFEDGPYKVVGLNIDKNGDDDICIEFKDRYRFDGFEAKSLKPAVCRVCFHEFMECECEYGDMRRLPNDGTREQLGREVDKLRLAAHGDWHLLYRNTKKGCKICKNLKQKIEKPSSQKERSLLKNLVKTLSKIWK